MTKNGLLSTGGKAWGGPHQSHDPGSLPWVAWTQHLDCHLLIFLDLYQGAGSEVMQAGHEPGSGAAGMLAPLAVTLAGTSLDQSLIEALYRLCHHFVFCSFLADVDPL